MFEISDTTKCVPLESVLFTQSEKEGWKWYTVQNKQKRISLALSVNHRVMRVYLGKTYQTLWCEYNLSVILKEFIQMVIQEIQKR